MSNEYGMGVVPGIEKQVEAVSPLTWHEGPGRQLVCRLPIGPADLLKIEVEPVVHDGRTQYRWWVGRNGMGMARGYEDGAEAAKRAAEVRVGELMADLLRGKKPR